MWRSGLPAAILALLLACGCESSDSEPAPDVQAAPDVITATDVTTTEDVVDESVPLSVMTFNVLCSFCWVADVDDPWEERLDDFPDIFSRHGSDLIGLQELSFAPEVDQFLTRNPDYEAVFYGAEDGWMEWPDATILYRSSRFELLDSGWFWLSPTPDEPGSTGFAEGAQFVRLVVWARLLDRDSGGELVFGTTHFDNNSPSQDLSAPLFLERFEPLADEWPVVLTGDFNSKPDTTAYGTLVGGVDGEGFRLVDVYDLAAEHEELKNLETPPAPYPPEHRIDHIFLAGEAEQWTVDRWAVDLFVYGEFDRFPSDHRAISAYLRY